MSIRFFLAQNPVRPDYPQAPVASRPPVWETETWESEFMPRRILRVTKWLTVTPAVAVCTQCNREFKVPLTALARTKDAQDYLQQEFDRHKCELQNANPNPDSN